MSNIEIPKRFPFRFSLRCAYLPELWNPTKKAEVLDESYRLPNLAELERGGNETVTKKSDASPVDFRIGWNEKGLSFSAIVSGKKRSPLARLTHPEESEGVQICLDTRDVRNVHRATRFCHRFAFLPLGQGNKGEEPVVLWFPIHRAKAHPNTVPVEKISIRATLLRDGYRVEATIPAEALTGYDPGEFSLLGFHYYIVDHELGDQAMLTAPPFPHDQDPSLWTTLECVGE